MYFEICVNNYIKAIYGVFHIVLDYLVGGFNPLEKYASQIESFPRFSGWKLKNRWNYHFYIKKYKHFLSKQPVSHLPIFFASAYRRETCLVGTSLHTGLMRLTDLVVVIPELKAYHVVLYRSYMYSIYIYSVHIIFIYVYILHIYILYILCI